MDLYYLNPNRKYSLPNAFRSNSSPPDLCCCSGRFGLSNNRPYAEMLSSANSNISSANTLLVAG